MARYPARLASRAWLALMAPMICSGDSSARALRNRAPGEAGRVMGQSPSKTQTLARAPGPDGNRNSCAIKLGPAGTRRGGAQDTDLLRREARRAVAAGRRPGST